MPFAELVSFRLSDFEEGGAAELGGGAYDSVLTSCCMRVVDPVKGVGSTSQPRNFFVHWWCQLLLAGTSVRSYSGHKDKYPNHIAVTVPTTKARLDKGRRIGDLR